MLNLEQMNVHIEPRIVAQVEELAEEHFKSKVGVIRAAIRTLAGVMEAHSAFAAQLEPELGELYMELARQMPAGFAQVPREGIAVGWAGDLPAVQIDGLAEGDGAGWTVFPDRGNGGLLAEERGGTGRIARIVDGEIKPLKLPSPEEVALN